MYHVICSEDLLCPKPPRYSELTGFHALDLALRCAHDMPDQDVSIFNAESGETFFIKFAKPPGN